MTIRNVFSYCFNPFDPSQHGLTELRKMSVPKQLFVLFSTAIAALLTLGIGTIATFRFLAHTFSVHEKSDSTQKIGKSVSQALPQVAVSSPQPVLGETDKIREIKKLHVEYLGKFQKKAQAGKWGEIRSDHFDWWMFPIMRPSLGHGDKFALSKNEIDVLKNDVSFMKDYQLGVKLVIASWGWDLDGQKWLRNSEWDNWNIRLLKIAESLTLFGEKDLFKKVKLFAQTVPIAKSDPNYKWFVKLGLLP